VLRSSLGATVAKELAEMLEFGDMIGDATGKMVAQV
jgi:hypothetical protein